MQNIVAAPSMNRVRLVPEGRRNQTGGVKPMESSRPRGLEEPVINTSSSRSTIDMTPLSPNTTLPLPEESYDNSFTEEEVATVSIVIILVTLQ